MRQSLEVALTSRAQLGTTTKSPPKRSAAVCGAPAAAARRGHAFWDHSATLGIRTCCGWSFGHSRGPVVVPRCARDGVSPNPVLAELNESPEDSIELRRSAV